MKYCMDYNRESKILDTIDEINVYCDHTELIVLIDFIRNHSNQRINIRLKDKQKIIDYKLIQKISQFYNEDKKYNIAIILPEYSKTYLDILKENPVPFFFDILVRDWETFWMLLDTGISDMYLVEQMCFEVAAAAPLAHQKGIRLHTFPAVLQRRYDNISTLKSFFIRPEDIKFYEDYFDVMDFLNNEYLNNDILYEIYAKDQYWYGQLKEIILGFDNDLDSRFILPSFAERRAKCGRNCLKGTSKCTMCETIEALSKNLKEAGFTIEIEEEDKNGEGSNSKTGNNE